MVTTYIEKNGSVFRREESENSVIEYYVGEKNKKEVIRIDESTVAEVSFEFDFEVGDYKEIYRTEREEPLLPEPIDELTSLKLALAELAEAYEREKTELQLVVAELAEIVTGGAE